MSTSLSSAGTPPTEVRFSRERLFVGALAVLAIAGMWLPWIASSLWLDESGTHWVIKDGWSEAVERSRHQGQTPLFYLIEWAVRSVAGSSELALRLPSALAILGAAALLARLGDRLIGRRAGLYAAAVFVALPGVAFVAVEARPYALATLTLTASSLAFIRWVDEGRKADAAIFVAMTALTLALSYLFGVAYIAHLFYALRRRPEGGHVGLPHLMLAGAGTLILLAPAAPHLLALMRQSDIRTSLPGGASAGELFERLIPPAIAAGALIGAGLGFMLERFTLNRRQARPSAMYFVTLWLVVPPLAFALLSRLIAPKFFQERYLVCAAPAFALLIGWALLTVADQKARVVIAASIVAISILAYTGGEHANEDWDGAARTVNSLVRSDETPVLVRTTFASGKRVGAEEAASGLLLAPLSLYPMQGSITWLPLHLNSETKELMDGLAAGWRRHDQVLLVTRAPFDGFPQWIEATLRPHGFRSRLRFARKNLMVFEYVLAPT